MCIYVCIYINTLQGFARFNVSAGARANEADMGTNVGYVAAGELPQGSFFPSFGT